jgi:hypothetical protein
LEVAEQISELLDAAPKKELENILRLVCTNCNLHHATLTM